MRRLAYKLLRFAGIALVSFGIVRLTVAHPGPAPELLQSASAKQCSAVLKIRCTVVFE